MDDFKDKAALVTGGATGIGLGVALALADAGCRVVATSLAEQDVAAARPANEGIEFRRLDVTSAGQIEQTIRELPRLDFLVNCAGVLLRNQAEFDPGQFAQVIEVNLIGTMRVCTACRPLLARNGGVIVNMASMLSLFGSGHVPGYSASKGGIVQLTKSLALAWARDGIRVNAVAPGWIATEMTRPLRENGERDREILARTPLGRWGTPADIAPVVLFLCSPAAGFITGVVLPVDGGYAAG